jgi:hypothetical protein
MSSTPQALQLSDGLATVRQLLDLIDALRKLANPATTVDGLTQAVAILTQLGTALGINQSWLDRINQLLSNPELLAIVTAMVQYLSSLVGNQQTASLRAIGGAA